MSKSRTKSSFFNISAGMARTVISTLISVLQRYVFVKTLDVTYLGVSGLFSNILLILSFAELGIGAALTQMFYKPFAEKDYHRLSVVTHTTQVMLNAVGYFVVGAAIAVTPFLQFFVNDMNAVPHMRLIFLLYGISSGITYFLGFYRTIITANQEAYKLLRLDFVWKIITFLILSIILILTRNFILYLSMQIALNFLGNYVVMLLVKKEYPQIDYHCKEIISREELKEFGKNIYGLSMNRLATVITQGTDNIIISKFLNLITVGYASNYTMITQTVSSMVEALFGPLLASIGNYCISETTEQQYGLYRRLNFASFWLYGFCSITAFSLADPFIDLVLGEEYVIAKSATLFLCFDIFCAGITRVSGLFRTAKGIFWYGRYKPLIQTLVNLISSLILVIITKKLWAVYAGTVLSRVLVTIWYDPLIVMKYGFNMKPREYMPREGMYFLIYGIAFSVMVFVTQINPLTGLMELVTDGILCVIAVNLLFAACFWRSNEFQYWLHFGLEFVKRFGGKIRQ